MVSRHSFTSAECCSVPSAAYRPNISPAINPVAPPPSPDSTTAFRLNKCHARWYGVLPDAFSAQWFGYLTVITLGQYTFALTADDAAVLSVDGRRLIENGGRHSAETRTADITLARGAHAVLIEFTHTARAYAIDRQWGRPDGRSRRVPGWALSPYKTPLWRVLVARGLDLAAIVLLESLSLLTPGRGRGAMAAIARHPRRPRSSCSSRSRSPYLATGQRSRPSRAT